MEIKTKQTAARISKKYTFTNKCARISPLQRKKKKETEKLKFEKSDQLHFRKR
jgi:hypothetical protein